MKSGQILLFGKSRSGTGRKAGIRMNTETRTMSDAVRETPDLMEVLTREEYLSGVAVLEPENDGHDFSRAAQESKAIMASLGIVDLYMTDDE